MYVGPHDVYPTIDVNFSMMTGRQGTSEILIQYKNICKRSLLTLVPVFPLFPGPPSCPLWPFAALEVTLKGPFMTSQNTLTMDKNM